jgi:hypothetical protein
MQPIAVSRAAFDLAMSRHVEIAFTGNGMRYTRSPEDASGYWNAWQTVDGVCYVVRAPLGWPGPSKVDEK